MAHVKVTRRSMSLKQWAKLQFERIEPLIVTHREPTSGWQMRLGQYLPDGYVWDHDFRPLAEGERWGRPDGTAQLKATLHLPPALAGHRVWLEFMTGAEVIVTCNGEILDGIDPNRTRILLASDAAPDAAYELLFDAYTRSVPDDMRNVRTRMLRGCVQRFRPPDLLLLDDVAEALKLDLAVLYRMAFGAAIDEEIRERFVHRTEALLALFPPYDCEPAQLRQAVPLLREFLTTEVFDKPSPYGHRGKLACVAHSHLDIAYHWKAAQTVQKNARTCLIQLRLMDRYPAFMYAHSQAWTYETLEQHYPQLFAEVKERIAEGRWEIAGGLYVEPDCNIPSAESLIRQVVYGKRYFLEAFGKEVDNCWLPDVFGNSAILPQILKLGGIDYFVSNKMSTWNDTNLFPHNNFIWRGVDGTDICACVPPVHFITWHDPNQIVESWDAFLDKETCDESLHMYGYGDGGSGVTDEMLEHYKRVVKLPGLPKLRLTTGREYLHSVFANTEGKLAVWDGELYLEMHRGTFTSKGDLKRRNRLGEHRIREVETLWLLANQRGVPYPASRLRDAWKLLLLNQFHDIIPGSHTTPVYHETLQAYAAMDEQLDTLHEQALDAVAPRASDTALCAVFNPFAHPRSTVVVADTEAAECPEGAVLQRGDRSLCPLQRQAVPGGGERLAAYIPDLAPLTAEPFELVPAAPESVDTPARAVASAADTGLLENAFFRLRFDAQQRLVEVLDKRRRRQVVPAGAVANEWQMFEDKPGSYNAWDILRNYRDHPIDLPAWGSAEVVEYGPVSIALRLTRAFGASRAEQVVRLYADVPRIDFETWIDWQETEKLLKVAFPVTVKSRIYTTDTSAGGLERDNHQNTPWQEARFEVCHHKWVDLSEGLFGVSLLNDCKYGCDVRGNTLRLSLLKAPIRPDSLSDKGEHRFTYSLFTHDGDWRRGGAVEAAFDLNCSPTLLPGRCPAPAMASASPLLTLESPAVKLLALKGDEDGSGDVVVRLVELYGAHVNTGMRCSCPIQQAWECDLLERKQAVLKPSDGGVELQFRPYQIRTIRLQLDSRQP